MEIKLQSVFASEMESYLELLRAANHSTEDYVYTFRSLDRFLVKNHITEKCLTESVLSAWLSEKNVTACSRNKEIRRMRVFAKYLRALNIFAYEMDTCKEDKTYQAYTFSDNEMRRIFEIADSGSVSYVEKDTKYIFPVVLRILYGTGLRISEALNLKWDDVDFAQGTLLIRETKNNKQRKVPMHPSLTEILKQYKTRRLMDDAPDEYLFANRERTLRPYEYPAFAYWFSKLLKAADIDNTRHRPFERCICTHDLRHNFAFRSFQKALIDGKRLEDTMPFLVAYLGHETFAETEKYLTTKYELYTDSQKLVSDAIQSVFPEVQFK